MYHLPSKKNYEKNSAGYSQHTKSTLKQTLILLFVSKHFLGTALIFWVRQKLTAEERDKKDFQKHFSFFWHWTVHPSIGSDQKSMQKYLIFTREPQEARQVYSAIGDTELGQCMRRKRNELTEQSQGLDHPCSFHISTLTLSHFEKAPKQNLWRAIKSFPARSW